MKKQTLAEAAKEILSGNVAAKRASGDGMNSIKQGKSTINEPLDSNSKVGEMSDGGPTPTDDKSGVKEAGRTGTKKAKAPGTNAPIGQEGVKKQGPVTANPSGVAEEMDNEEDNIDEENAPEITEEEEKLVEETLGEEGSEEITEGEETVTEEEEEIVEVPTVEERVKEVLDNTKFDLSDDVNAIFNGEKLSEDFMKKVKTIFEGAVVRKVVEVSKTVCESVETQYVTQLEEVTEQLKEDLEEKVDDYMNFMVEEWVKDNEIAIEKGLRTEITEDFISGLRNLFIENYIDVPEDKVSVVEELSEKIEELTEQLNGQIEDSIEKNKELSELKKEIIFTDISSELTDTQSEKLKNVSEAVEYTNEEEYTEALKVLKENYFPSNNAGNKVLSENDRKKDSLNSDIPLITEEDEKKETKTYLDPEMEALVQAISKRVKK